MSLEEQFQDHIHDLLYDIGGIYASRTLIGLSLHAENMFTLVLAAKDAEMNQNATDFERISWGIFWYCLHDVDLQLTTELREHFTPYEMHAWITGDYYAIVDKAVTHISTVKPEWQPLKVYITSRKKWSCPMKADLGTPLGTVRENYRGATLSICIRAIETLLLQETAPLLKAGMNWSGQPALKRWFVGHEVFEQCKNVSRNRETKLI